MFHNSGLVSISARIFLAPVIRWTCCKITVWTWSPDSRSISDLLCRQAPSQSSRQNLSQPGQMVRHILGWENKKVFLISLATYHPLQSSHTGVCRYFGATNFDRCQRARRQQPWGECPQVCYCLLGGRRRLHVCGYVAEGRPWLPGCILGVSLEGMSGSVAEASSHCLVGIRLSDICACVILRFELNGIGEERPGIRNFFVSCVDTILHLHYLLY